MMYIFKKEIGCNTETKVTTTSSETMERDLCKVLEQFENNGYIQCDASKEEMEVWDNQYKDWIVVCDNEFEEDRILIFVK
jgi:L-lactate utilization protein LutC